MQRFDRCGETYYSCSDIYKFIETCCKHEECIICIEFYDIIEEYVIPYEGIQSIESSKLIDNSISKLENVLQCNNFIRECITKCYKSIKDKYFTAIIE